MGDTIVTPAAAPSAGGEHPEQQLVDLGRAEVTAEHAEQTANMAEVVAEIAAGTAETASATASEAAEAAVEASAAAESVSYSLESLRDELSALYARLDAIEAARPDPTVANETGEGVTPVVPDAPTADAPVEAGEEPARAPARRHGLKRRAGGR